VRLFVERARSHKPSFELNEREAPAVAELVARLEGIPLALELAAARVRAMSVADINTRLKDRYKLLTGGGRVLQERQQTLRALVDWSYDMLAGNEQMLLNRLGVFVGGFDLETAEQVCGAEPLDSMDVLDLLTSLVEKSLVMLDEREEGTRYKMLETIADYAREKLRQSEDAESTPARHCDHFLAMAKSANMGLMGPDQAKWTQRVETELDNLRSAMALALSGGVDPIIAVKLTVAMMGFWMQRGYTTEGRNAVRAALAMPAVQSNDVAHAWALYVGAALAESQSAHAQAREMLESCLVLRRGLGNPVDIAATLSTLSLVRLQSDDAAGAAVGEQEALQIFRLLGDRIGEAIGLLHLGQIHVYLGESTQAHAHLERCLAIAREVKNREIEGECELVMGETALEAGDLATAILRFTRSLTICREAGDKRGEANALWWLGKADLRGGDVASARSRLGEALRAFRAFEMWAELIGCLEDQAGLAHAEGNDDLAVRRAAAASASREGLGLARPPRVEHRWQEQLVALRQTMSSEVFDAAWNQGRAAWELNDDVHNALSAQIETRAASMT